MSRIVSSSDTLGGKPRIEGTRIRVVDIVGFYEKRELSPEEIAEEFDINEIDVYAALVYYYENPKDIRKQLYRDNKE